MKFLIELLAEFYGRGADRDVERQWREQRSPEPLTAADEKDWWVVTPANRKYGPFPSYDRAISFYKNRTDIDRKSQLKAVRKGGRI